MKFNLTPILFLLLPLTLLGCNSGTSTVTPSQPCNPCMVYGATNQGNGFNGNLKAQAATILNTTYSNGITAADALCNFDESKPALPSSATYKALLVDGVNRGWNPTINWVLHSNTTYVNSSGNLIGISTESAILNFPTESNFAMFIGLAWSGLGGSSASTVWQAGVDNCSGWSSAESSVWGNTGYEDYADPTYALIPVQLFQGNNKCNQNQSGSLPIGLICVQQ
ncbi:MAG: DUF1554 domain-containing protein [Burkholderiales bacterium]|nr:DUF1554 domain-containing protein [Burkholderiales bacterium]MBX9889797.1 DUF1554 domain-containing protein [Amoebophilaceae bacterium]